MTESTYNIAWSVTTKDGITHTIRTDTKDWDKARAILNDKKKEFENIDSIMAIEDIH